MIEKSPESSPTTKPRQGGAVPHPPSPPHLAPTSTGAGRLILPTGMFPVLQPEPHYAQVPSSNHGSASPGVYPALTKHNSPQDLQGIRVRDDDVTEGQRDGWTTPNGYHHHHHHSLSAQTASCSASASSSQLLTQVDRWSIYLLYKVRLTVWTE